MYIDIIAYQLATDIQEEDLFEAAKDILDLWMNKQEGFVGWDIHKTKDGYIDFVHWENKASADKAGTNMKDIPQDHPWLKCYDMTTVTAQKATQIFTASNT